MPATTPCRWLRLEPTYDVELLARDLAICVEAEWQRHFNTQDYSGTWTSLAFYSASGREEDIATHGGPFVPTPLLQRCEYIREILDGFQCAKESVRLLQLAPGSQIHEHRDNRLAYEFGALRLHVPIRTSAGVDFIVDGERLEMQGGELWYANFNLPHSVNNNGEESRVHLVIDLTRNEWTDDLFRRAGYDFEAEKRCLEPDLETRRRMMEELARMDTEGARMLLEQMRKEHEAT
jgi:quercetin dioxygenase-like cupin family protein